MTRKLLSLYLKMSLVSGTLVMLMVQVLKQLQLKDRHMLSKLCLRQISNSF